MRVLVAGIRSALGSRVAELLRVEGHEIVGLSRSPLPGAVVADLFDADATCRAVRSVAPDAIVQTVNALPKAGPRNAEDLAATARLRIDGTRNLVAAAWEANVHRYVAEAFAGGYDAVPLGAPPVTEDAPFGVAPFGVEASETVMALGVLDREVREYGGITVRCGNFYGPGLGSTESQIAMLRRRRLPAIRGAVNLLPYIHIDDAASAVVAALLRGRPGEAYNAVADVAETPGTFLREVAAAIGAKPPWTAPRWLFRVAAGAHATAFLTRNVPLSNTKARTELGWAPAYPTLADGAKTLA